MRPFFSQNNLIDMLSASDLDMGAIGKEKTAVFLIIPDENTLYHRLVSVFVKQCYTDWELREHGVSAQLGT
jgi:type IV secretion system protein VirD4